MQIPALAFFIACTIFHLSPFYHAHISLCYKVHTQTDIHFNNLDLFIIFFIFFLLLLLPSQICFACFHPLISWVLKLRVHKPLFLSIF